MMNKLLLFCRLETRTCKLKYRSTCQSDGLYQSDTYQSDTYQYDSLFRSYDHAFVISNLVLLICYNRPLIFIDSQIKYHQD